MAGFRLRAVEPDDQAYGLMRSAVGDLLDSYQRRACEKVANSSGWDAACGPTAEEKANQSYVSDGTNLGEGHAVHRIPRELARRDERVGSRRLAQPQELRVDRAPAVDYEPFHASYRQVIELDPAIDGFPQACHSASSPSRSRSCATLESGQ